jgi:hypothetical protein
MKYDSVKPFNIIKVSLLGQQIGKADFSFQIVK